MAPYVERTHSVVLGHEAYTWPSEPVGSSVSRPVTVLPGAERPGADRNGLLKAVARYRGAAGEDAHVRARTGHYRRIQVQAVSQVRPCGHGCSRRARYRRCHWGGRRRGRLGGRGRGTAHCGRRDRSLPGGRVLRSSNMMGALNDADTGRRDRSDAKHRYRCQPPTPGDKPDHHVIRVVSAGWLTEPSLYAETHASLHKVTANQARRRASRLIADPSTLTRCILPQRAPADAVFATHPAYGDERRRLTSRLRPTPVNNPFLVSLRLDKSWSVWPFITRRQPLREHIFEAERHVCLRRFRRDSEDMGSWTPVGCFSAWCSSCPSSSRPCGSWVPDRGGCDH